MSNEIVKLSMSTYQIKEVAKFCRNQGLDLESVYDDLTGTDRQDEGDRAFDSAQRWYKLEEELESYLHGR